MKYTLQNEVYADAARSVRLVRSRAEEWGVDPGRLGFIGSSAGGEVAGMVETRFDAGKPRRPIRWSGLVRGRISSFTCTRHRDPARLGLRPERAIYPITIAKNPLFPVPKDAPPAFLVCTDDDPSHVTATVKLYLELQANHISSEMHIYSYGEHGFALRPTKKPERPSKHGARGSRTGWPFRIFPGKAG